MTEHRDAVLAAATNRLRRQRPVTPALAAARDANLPMLIESVLGALRIHENEGPESAPRVASGAHIAGPQASFDIDELVFQYESLCHSVHETGKQLDIDIAVEADSSLEVEGDHDLLVTVLKSLLQNAVKVTRPRGSVSVKAHAISKARAVVEIEARCDAIAADVIETLFTPFAQVASDASSLGLVHARQVIDAHGGTIEVKNLLPERGCVFVVEIPTSQGPLEPPER